jgi:hypothetical protein
MIQSTTLHDRRPELGTDVLPEPRDLRPAAVGDFARGQRTNPVHAFVRGDFATGMRLASMPATIGDFATGMRTSNAPTVTGDFATGMRSLPAVVRLGQDAAVERTSLPIAA